MPYGRKKQHRKYRAFTDHGLGAPNPGLQPINKPEKKYFKILQAIHHAEILEETQRTGQFPVGMMRQIKKLTSFIKPSSPCEETSLKVKANTERWMQANMIILKEHYDEVIAKNIHDLPPYDPTAFEKAVAYGKTRYKNKLTVSSTSNLACLVKEVRITSQREPDVEPCFDPTRRDEEWPVLGTGEGTLADQQRNPTSGTNRSKHHHNVPQINPNPGSSTNSSYNPPTSLHHVLSPNLNHHPSGPRPNQLFAQTPEHPSPNLGPDTNILQNPSTNPPHVPSPNLNHYSPGPNFHLRLSRTPRYSHSNLGPEANDPGNPSTSPHHAFFPNHNQHPPGLDSNRPLPLAPGAETERPGPKPRGVQNVRVEVYTMEPDMPSTLRTPEEGDTGIPDEFEVHEETQPGGTRHLPFPMDGLSPMGGGPWGHFEGLPVFEGGSNRHGGINI